MAHCIHNIVCKLADSQWCNDNCMYKLVEEKFISINKSSKPCLTCINNKCVACMPCSDNNGYACYRSNTAHVN